MKWYERLFTKKPKVGLALSGGATHGAAHIGVLQVLEHEGIHPDFVAGTSAGALVGAMYCAGVPLDTLEHLFLSMKWPTIVRLAIKNPLCLFDIRPIDHVIKKSIGDINFEDLKIPFAAVCCDLMTGDRIVLDHGPLAPAIRASASVPGLFAPVDIDGRMLVDGGLVDNLPIQQVSDMGAQFTIASDVSIRGEFSKKPGNVFEVLQTMFVVMQDRGALDDTDKCDCYIRPRVTQFSCWGFGEGRIIIEEGRKAAEQAMPELRKQLRLRQISA